MERVKPLAESLGGQYLVRGGSHEVLEDDWKPTRLVLLEFLHIETARKLFSSDEYAPLKHLRQSCSSGHVVIVEGL